MKALFISINDPFGVGGGDFATHAYLLAFSKLCNGDVDVFVREGVKPDGSIDANYFFVPERNWLARIRSLINGQLHRNVGAVRKRLNEGVRYDYCVFNNSRVATGLIRQMKELGINVITIHHNVEKEIVLGNTSNPIRRILFSHFVVKSEKEAYQLSDYNFFLTKQDQSTFHRLYGRGDSVEAIIGTFEYKAVPALQKTDIYKGHLTFAITGSLNQKQGIDGVMYFFDELYRYLPDDSNVIISGRNPSPAIVSACNRFSNIRLVPNPKDMNEIISMADVYICPTRLGGGLKLRVMDGLRIGIPVITHACSARGYDALVDSGYVSVFNNSDEFSEKLRITIEHVHDGSFSRANIRQRYEDFFSFEAGYERIRSVLQTIKQ
ncbi:MAG: glycosyltransferase [Bacteroidaceae bacterium]|nr:glycosyltransferase [Bacteroidaceae bacterium]